MLYSMIEPEERKGKVCHFCGTEKSVKYTLDILNYNPIIGENEIYTVECCNKCLTSRIRDEWK